MLPGLIEEEDVWLRPAFHPGDDGLKGGLHAVGKPEEICRDQAVCQGGDVRRVPLAGISSGSNRVS
jgi:hypothetical protein